MTINSYLVIFHITLFFKCSWAICTLERFFIIVHSSVVGQAVHVHECLSTYFTHVLVCRSTQISMSLIITLLLKPTPTVLALELFEVGVWFDVVRQTVSKFKLFAAMRTFQGISAGGFFLIGEIILWFCDIIISCHILIFLVRDTLLMLVVLATHIEVFFPLPGLYNVFLHHHLHPLCQDFELWGVCTLDWDWPSRLPPSPRLPKL